MKNHEEKEVKENVKVNQTPSSDIEIKEQYMAYRRRKDEDDCELRYF
jgi:hypothetical protein